MQKYLKRICAIFVAICVFCLSSVSVLADDSSNPDDKEYIQKVGFYHLFAGSEMCRKFVGYTTGQICPNTEDGYHRASSYEEYKKPLIGDPYYSCICEHCGHTFKAYESDLKQSYEAQVAEMPATEYNSDGSLLLYPSDSCLYVDWGLWVGSTHELIACPHYFGSHYVSSRSLSFNISFDCDNYTITATLKDGCSSFSFKGSPVCLFRFDCPIDGMYSKLSPSSFSGYYIKADGTRIPFSREFVSYSSPVFYSAGKSIDYYSNSDYGEDMLYFTVKYDLPSLKVTPYDSIIDEVNTTYNINSRPTSITGNYGIIGDDGKLVQVSGNTIINETNNTYYNPATGETTPITSWSYDYSDRSYTVTKEDGDTTTITYGDENVTITEGDTVYNIYYIVSGDGEDPPSSCAHSWTETSRTDPTCTTPGQASYSCSKCGETKSETLKATGHTWEVERTVQTAYDENGNLTQEGYTLYKCSVCGEQYKDTESTGPPGPSPGEGEDDDKESIWDKIGNFFGSIVGGVGELLDAVLGKLLDALTSLAGTLLEKLSGVVETVLTVLDELPKLFGGFLDFLGIIFPFLPPEITLLLTFGVVAVVFAAIIKAIRS